MEEKRALATLEDVRASRASGGRKGRTQGGVDVPQPQATDRLTERSAAGGVGVVEECGDCGLELKEIGWMVMVVFPSLLPISHVSELL